MDNKEYKKMTPEEQLKWLTDFTTFSKSKLPILSQLGDAWEAAHFKVFEEGLQLLNAFIYCRDFVSNSLYYGDYSRRVERMQFFVNQVRDEISQGMVMKGVDGERVVYVPTANVGRRRGRPKKEEAAEREAAQEENKVEEEKAMAIAELNDATPMEKSVQREPNNEELLAEKKKQAAQTPSLFAEMENAEPQTSPVDLLITENRPHLDQIAFLLSAETATSVSQLREIRTSMAAASERAKILAEQGAGESTIRPYAEKAAELVKVVEDIYLRVDSELARLYVLMPMDKTLGGKRALLEQRHLTDASLLTILRPYYEKRKQEDPDFEKRVIAEFEESRPEVIAARKAEAERNEEIAALRKYITRKDKKASPSRVKGIAERIERLKELGEDVSAMELILEKTKEDLAASKN